MTTKWNKADVSNKFDAYDDYVEDSLGYRPMIEKIKRSLGTNISVLDYGCGGGKVSRRLTQSGIHNVIGVDISATMIEKAQAAQATTSNGKIQYRKINSGELPFPASTFDAAVCCYVFINVSEREELYKIAAEIFRTLKPKACIYLLDSNPASTGIRFSSFVSGKPGIEYKDGDERSVFLDIPGQDVFNIYDRHWSLETYYDVLSLSGFCDIDLCQISAREIPEEDRYRLGKAEHEHSPFIQITAKKPE